MAKWYLKCTNKDCPTGPAAHAAHSLFCYRCGSGLEKWQRKCSCGHVGGFFDRYCTECGEATIERKLPWRTK